MAFQPVTMERRGATVVVRTAAEFWQRQYDGWTVLGSAPTDPVEPPPVVDPPTTGDLSAYATKVYVVERVAGLSAVGHGHSISDVADLARRTDIVDRATSAATGSAVARRDSAGGIEFSQVVLTSPEPLLDGHAVPLAFVRRSLAGYVTQEYFDAQTANLVRRIRDLEQGTYPEPDPGPTPAMPGTFQALMGALL